jgi:hypothetical protein
MRRRLAGGLLVLPAVLALALAGCGKPADSASVATAGGGGGANPSASATATLSDSERQLKFAQCMRDNGVDMPDPEAGGKAGAIRVGGDGDPSKTKAAMDKCRSYLPNGGEAVKLDPAQAENMRKMSQCMRENGVPNFPDPDADGRIQFDIGLLGIDRNDPKLKAAMEKCQQYAPKMAGAGK